MTVGLIVMALSQTAHAADEADRLLAASCRGCHVSAAASGSIPSLEGQTSAALQAQLLAYKRGMRQGTLMGRISRGYSDEELRRIADVFASEH